MLRSTEMQEWAEVCPVTVQVSLVVADKILRHRTSDSKVGQLVASLFAEMLTLCPMM